MTWYDNAACRGKTHIMYPDANRGIDIAEAKTICATCPVIKQCADAGIDEPDGIWGGLEPLERERLRGQHYPSRRTIRLRIDVTCAWCGQILLIYRGNQKYCEGCKQSAEKHRDKQRHRTNKHKTKIGETL